MSINISGNDKDGVSSQYGNNDDETVSRQNVCKENWKGSIPIRLTLAPTSLSSSTMPLPYHCMVSRMTFLHIGLKPYILRLYKFAPQLFFTQSNKYSTTQEEEEPENTIHDSNDRNKDVLAESNHKNDEIEKQEGDSVSSKKSDDNNNNQSVTSNDNSSDNRSNNNPKEKGKNENNNDDDESKGQSDNENEDDPVCWFEDEETGSPLRWHLFVGVLWDMLQQQPLSQRRRRLPWNIRVHFTSYPQSQLLQFSDHTPVSLTVQKFYSNSLKQALFLQYGTSKVAMSISKSDHVQLWDSIVRSQWISYQEINQALQIRIPIDTQVPIKPSIDKAINMIDNVAPTDNCTFDHYKMLQNVPVRIMVDGKPFIQKVCLPFVEMVENEDQSLTGGDEKDHIHDDGLDNSNKSSKMRKRTLGELLAEWCPTLYHSQSDNQNEDSPPISSWSWMIQGVQIPLTFPIVDVWQCLCHPDHFLYIIVVTDHVGK